MQPPCRGGRGGGGLGAPASVVTGAPAPCPCSVPVPGRQGQQGALDSVLGTDGSSPSARVFEFHFPLLSSGDRNSFPAWLPVRLPSGASRSVPWVAPDTLCSSRGCHRLLRSEVRRGRGPGMSMSGRAAGMGEGPPGQEGPATPCLGLQDPNQLPAPGSVDAG